MKAFKGFIFFGFMTAIGFAVYYFFEQDWQSIWAYINGKTSVNPLKKYPFYNLLTGGTGVVNNGNVGTISIGGTGTGGTGNGGTGNGGTGNGGTGNGGTGNGGNGNGGNGNGGVADFKFVQTSNGKSLPNKPQGNSYTLVHFPSHSRVATQVELTPSDVFAHCEYGLKNSKGEEIVHLLDTIGGFHQNFFDGVQRAAKGNDFYKWVDDWANSFKPFGAFSDAKSRGNNHFDEYKKYVEDGSFTFWYKNKSNSRHTVTAGFIRASNGEGDLNVIVEPYTEYSKVLNISSNGNEYDPYKINTNNYSL